MQARTSTREKTSTSPPAFALAPLGQAVMDTFTEGIAIFDAFGRLLYANQRARGVIEALDGNGGTHHGEGLREQLIAFGGRARALKQGAAELGEVLFLSDGDGERTLAERERQAILDTLESTRGKLAETARRLGISRTTLWRRLRAYGLRPSNGHGGRGTAART
jgi:regulatory Fis family protein